MFNYSNGFTYAVNESKKEIMLSFRQTYPQIDEKGVVVKVTSDSVADVVLTQEGLIALRQLLSEINLSEENT